MHSFRGKRPRYPFCLEVSEKQGAEDRNLCPYVKWSINSVVVDSYYNHYLNNLWKVVISTTERVYLSGLILFVLGSEFLR
jgi:hypothetical protein